MTSAGILATAQCQNPLPVGAVGSNTVTAKLLVQAGKPDHDSCGEVSVPPAPKMPLTWAEGRISSSWTSVLVTANAGTTRSVRMGFLTCLAPKQVVGSINDWTRSPRPRIRPCTRSAIASVWARVQRVLGWARQAAVPQSCEVLRRRPPQRRSAQAGRRSRHGLRRRTNRNAQGPLSGAIPALWFPMCGAFVSGEIFGRRLVAVSGARNPTTVGGGRVRPERAG